MVVYLDILFMLNLIMNYIILIIASSFGSIYAKRSRIFLSAFLGAIYGIIIFFNLLEFMSFWIFKIAICVIMTVISFGTKNILKNTVLVFLVSFVIAGVIIAMFYLSKNPEYMMINGVPYIDISLSLLVCVFILCYVSMSVLHRGLYKNKLENTKDIHIKIEEKELKVSAFCDSGNNLYDSITGKPIIVVESAEIAKILPCELSFLIKDDAISSLGFLSGLKENNLKIRIINYKSLGNSSAMMIVFSPSEIVDSNGKSIDALVGISHEKIELAGAKAIMGV